MKAVVLAGGFGTRMYPFTEVIPKCLLPVDGVPVSRRIIDDFRAQGFEDIILCVNEPHKKQFEHEFRDIHLTTLKFSVSPEPQGTAGELLYAKPLIGEDPFILHYGDDLTKVNYKDLIKFHNENQAGVTLAVTSKVPLSVGLIEATFNIVTGFNEKPFLSKSWAWTAVGVFGPSVFDWCHKGWDIAKDVIPKMIKKGFNIYAYDTNSIWIDAGNLYHWRLANKLAREGKI